MRKFNLEEAKAGAPVCTRDGRPARIICTDREGTGGLYPIVALTMRSDGIETCETYREDGRLQKAANSAGDLMMAEGEGTTRVRWGVMRRGEKYQMLKQTFATLEEAEEAVAGRFRYIITKIEWEE